MVYNFGNGASFKSRVELLNPQVLAVGTHQGIKDGQNVTAVVHHARENITELRVTLRFAMPLDKNCSGNLDVPAQLIRRMPAKEEPVEKRRLTLREVQILQDFGGNELWHRGHKEKGSLPKSLSTSSRTAACLTRSRQLSSGELLDTDRKAHATPWLPGGSNRRRIILGMVRLPKQVKGSLAGRTLGRLLRFGVLSGLRSVEIDPEEFRRQLSDKHGLWIPNFTRMKDVPIEKLDAIANKLIRDAERLALIEGAGFGLGGMITFLPDASFLTVITLRLIQRLALLYGFAEHGRNERLEMWKAAASAAGIDYGKDLAEKQLFEKLAPRIAERFAARVGAEAAEKWVGRLIPLASSAIGGALNFSLVRAWGRRVQRHLRAKHLAANPSASPASPSYTAAEAAPV